MTSPFLIDSTVNVPFVFTSQNLNVLFAQIALARLLPPFLLIRDASLPLGLRNLGLGPLLSTLCCYHTYWIFWFSLGSLQHVTLSRPLKPCLFLTRPAFWNLCPLGSGILGLGQMLGLLPLCFMYFGGWVCFPGNGAAPSLVTCQVFPTLSREGHWPPRGVKLGIRYRLWPYKNGKIW